MVTSDSGAGPYNPAGYIRGLISEGVGPTEGLRIFRDDAGRINDARWFDLYKEVNATIGRQPEWLTQDPSSLPSPDQYGTFAAGQGGQYVTTVEMQLIDRGTGLWYTQKTEFWTSEPHTPEEAEADALANWGNDDTQNQYEHTTMGAIATGFYVTTPFNP